MRRLSWRPRKQSIESPDSTFKSYIKKSLEANGGTVHIYRYDPEIDQGLPGMSLGAPQDVKDWKDRDPEAYLSAAHGGGVYKIRIDTEGKDGKEMGSKTFTFSIAGEPKETRYESTRKKQKEAEQVTEIFKMSMDFAKDFKGDGNGSTAAVVALIQSNQQMLQANQASMQQMMSLMIENQKSSTENLIRIMEGQRRENPSIADTLQDMMALSEFKNSLEPHVERDSTLEWAKLIANSPITAGLFSKMANIPLPENQSIPMIPVTMPGATAGNLGDVDKNIEKDIGSPVQHSENLTPSDNKAAHIDIDRNSFEVTMVDPLIEFIDAGAPPENIAIVIDQIIQWSITQRAIGLQVHPLMAGFHSALENLNTGPQDEALNQLEKAYNDFCQAIEMPKEMIEPVKLHLIRRMMPVFMNSKKKDVIEDGKPEDTKASAAV